MLFNKNIYKNFFDKKSTIKLAVKIKTRLETIFRY